MLFDDDIAVVGEFLDSGDIESGCFQRLVALLETVDLLVKLASLIGCFVQPRFELLVDGQQSFEMFS